MSSELVLRGYWFITPLCGYEKCSSSSSDWLVAVRFLKSHPLLHFAEVFGAGMIRRPGFHRFKICATKQAQGKRKRRFEQIVSSWRISLLERSQGLC